MICLLNLHGRPAHLRRFVLQLIEFDRILLKMPNRIPSGRLDLSSYIAC